MYSMRSLKRVYGASMKMAFIGFVSIHTYKCFCIFFHIELACVFLFKMDELYFLCILYTIASVRRSIALDTFLLYE